MKILWILSLIVLLFALPVNADVIERNVITGQVIRRPYTQKELDDIATSITAGAQSKAVEEKALDIDKKRNAAIEELLMSGTSVKAKAYQDSLK